MFFERKKENIFFVKFRDFAISIESMGQSFSKIFNDYNNAENAIIDLKKVESECDTKAHEMLNELNESFITPFDREDIYAIIEQLDDIADLIEEAANMLLIYKIKTLRSDAIEMVNLIESETHQVKVLFDVLPDYRKHDTALDATVEINRLEDTGDQLFRKALTKLLEEETDPITIIKWKDIYEDLEDTLDACEKLADTIEGVMMKNA